MSRCYACNHILEEAELTRKDPRTGDYLDLCGECYRQSEDAVMGFDPEYSGVYISTSTKTEKE